MRKLGRNNETGNTGRSQSGQDTGNQSRYSKLGDVTSTRGGELTEDTDLDTQGTNVAEAAKGVGGDELRAGRQGGVVRLVGKGSEGIVLVL